MAYSSSAVVGMGPVGMGPRKMFLYSSSDSATDIAATGYFAKAGAGSITLSSEGPIVHGFARGDLLVNVESSAGANPYRVSHHAVSASTADQASTSASTGYRTAYNATVSAHAST